MKGLKNTQIAQWCNGSECIVPSDGVSVTVSNEGLSTLTFSPLKTSHAKRYTCQGIIMSPALSESLIVSNYSILRVSSKSS